MENWLIPLPPDSPMAYLADHIHDNEVLLDLQTAAFITGQPSTEFLKGIMVEDLGADSGSFFHHFHNLALLHEQYHFYQYSNCSYLIRAIEDRHLIYREWRNVWRSGSRDLSKYRPLADAIRSSTTALKASSDAGISIVGLIELGSVMLEAALLEPRGNFTSLFQYVTATRESGPCNDTAWVLNYWRDQVGESGFGSLWFLTFLALCQPEPVSYFEHTVQGIAKTGGIQPDWNATRVEDDLIRRGVCSPNDFNYWWRTNEPSKWTRVNPIYDTVVKARLFVPGIMPSGPELGNVTPATFFLFPNYCLDIIPAGYWGAMQLPLRPVCFPREELFWLGPKYGGELGSLYDQHARLLQLEYMFDTSMIELLLREELDFFRDFGFS